MMSREKCWKWNFSLPIITKNPNPESDTFPAAQVASGSLLEGQRRFLRSYKFEIRNPKHETNSKNKNSNDRKQGTVHNSPL